MWLAATVVGQCGPRSWLVLCRFWTTSVGSSLIPQSAECLRLSSPYRPLWEAACISQLRGSDDLQGGQEGVLEFASFLAHLLGTCTGATFLSHPLQDSSIWSCCPRDPELRRRLWPLRLLRPGFEPRTTPSPGASKTVGSCFTTGQGVLALTLSLCVPICQCGSQTGCHREMPPLSPIHIPRIFLGPAPQLQGH